MLYNMYVVKSNRLMKDPTNQKLRGNQARSGPRRARFMAGTNLIVKD
jgi:hypothetical protein